jgi:hypothetical protein
MPYRIAVLMPSVVYFADSPLSYSDVRSVYSPEERARQTEEGIASVRTALPTARIIMVEAGLKGELPGGVEKLADRYIYIGSNPAVRRVVDGPNKGHGEAVQLLAAHGAAMEFPFRYYLKLSGRYKLSTRFNFGEWVRTPGALIAKKYNESCICTRLYGFTASFYKTWRRGLLEIVPHLRRGVAVEDAMPKAIQPIEHLSPLGVYGMLAPYGCGANE